MKHNRAERTRMDDHPPVEEPITRPLGSMESPLVSCRRLHAPNAPPRSSAIDAGIVDGWERLPRVRNPKVKHSPLPSAARQEGPHIQWLRIAILGTLAVLLTCVFALLVTSGSPNDHTPGRAQESDAAAQQ